MCWGIGRPDLNQPLWPTSSQSGVEFGRIDPLQDDPTESTGLFEMCLLVPRLLFGLSMSINGWSSSLADHPGVGPMIRTTESEARWTTANSMFMDLAERIEGQIERKASGRIRDLHVDCDKDLITLRGRSRTYHAKQLALQAVLDLTDGHTTLTNLIVVS